VIADPREVVFAVGVLRARGLSEQYSQVIAERVLVPGADLGVGDTAYLEIIRTSQRALTSTFDPRWASAN
jgi:hypothetical protein